ncbi:MAG TPA: HDOD domain-containing protein [Bacillaceae bacterium]
MDVFVARQPILNKKEELVGYEVLYRNTEINAFPIIDGDQATADVIVNGFLNIGIHELSAGQPCFINFTETLLRLKVPAYFHPRDIVVEILETVEITEEIITICKELNELGYTIALDDFTHVDHNCFYTELLKYVHIIKVDFLNASMETRTKIENLAKKNKIKLLAEKVETREQFREAKEKGYDFFQGYFFSKPDIVSSYDIPTSFLSYFQVMKKIGEEDIDIPVISQLIEQDLSLSHKLLKLINSPAFRPIHKIKSIRQAIVLLGLREIQKWVYVLALRENKGFSKKLSSEVIRLSLTRAMLCEKLAGKRLAREDDAGYFLTGMLSLMDSITRVPMEEILRELPLSQAIHDALTGKDSPLKEVLDLVIAVERGNWRIMEELAAALKLSELDIRHAYQESCKWAEDVISETAANY